MRDEDDLRAALRSLESDAPDPAAVLRAARSGGSALRNPRPARQKVIAAVAAAAAVTAVVTGVVAVTGRPGTRPAPSGGPSCRPPAPAAVRPPDPAGSSPAGRSAGPAGHRELSQIPPYYIALTVTKRPFPFNPDNAVVYSSVTGTRLATVTPPPPYRTFVDVSAAADDRTFAVAAQSTRTEQAGAVVFFLVHFSPARRQARLTRITGPAVPAQGSLDAFALSPDGRKLAVAWDTNGHHPQTRLQVTDLVTGKSRSWASAAGDVEGDTASPWSVSWAADSRTLAINWIAFPLSHQPGTGPGSGLRVLDAEAAGTDLVACSRLALPFRGPERETPAGALGDVAFLTPSGGQIVGAVSAHGKLGYAVFSARTGRTERIGDFREVRAKRGGGPPNVLWASQDGSVMVVYAPAGHNGRIGILAGGRLRLLPQSSRISFPAAAW